MANEDLRQKLTAILSADVKDYSRLLSQDRVSTIKTLNDHREMFADFVEQYGGRVVDTPGDNILMVLESVSDAVNCAVEIQRDLAERNAEVPSARMMQWRIGVNLGDVVEENGKVYGDGINIAARVEKLAEPGGICVSGRVYDQVHGKLGLEYESLGEQTVKNIANPIRIYHILSYPGAPAHKVVKARSAVAKKWRKIVLAIAAVLIVAIGSVLILDSYLKSVKEGTDRYGKEGAALKAGDFPSFEKPTVAILPFDNLSGNAKYDAFCDGITEQIIARLSKVPHLSVTARNSTFAYKGMAAKIQEIAADVNVRYVVEGSVQEFGHALRITAQLIDATSGYHLWADTYDKPVTDLRKIQDDIARDMITTLQMVLIEGEYANEIAKSTTSLEALEYFWQAEYHLLKLTREDLAIAQRKAKESVEADPTFAGGWSVLGFIHFHQGQLSYSESRQDSHRQAEEYARKALSFDPHFAKAWALLGVLDEYQGNYERARERLRKAVSISSNVHHWSIRLGTATFRSGRFGDAIALYKKAMRMNPKPPEYLLFYLSYAQYFDRQYEEAIEVGSRLLKKALEGDFSILFSRFVLAAIYAELGQEDDARHQIKEILKMDSSFTWQSWIDIEPMERESDRIRLRNAVVSAGLPIGTTEKEPSTPNRKPSIAVLPFVNMSTDPDDSHFGDIVADAIITGLSKIPSLSVVARSTSFTYGGKTARQIGKELGVNFILEGTIQKSSNRLRITTQLIDSTTSHHIWSENFDQEMRDLFSIQDDITRKIMTAVQVELTHGEQVRAWEKGTEDVAAYIKFLRAFSYFEAFKSEELAKARQLAEEAIELDPGYSAPYGLLGFIHLLGVSLGGIESFEESLESAERLVLRALEINEHEYVARSVLGVIYARKGQHERGVAECRRAVSINPNWSFGYFTLGVTLYNAGRYGESIAHLNRAIRLNPYPPGYYLTNLALVRWITGKYKQAIALCNEVVEDSRRLESEGPHTILVLAYISLGQIEKAQEEARELKRINPEFSVEKRLWTMPFRDRKVADLYRENLRKAGLE